MRHGDSPSFGERLPVLTIHLRAGQPGCDGMGNFCWRLQQAMQSFYTDAHGQWQFLAASQRAVQGPERPVGRWQWWGILTAHLQTTGLNVLSCKQSHGQTVPSSWWLSCQAAFDNMAWLCRVWCCIKAFSMLIKECCACDIVYRRVLESVQDTYVSLMCLLCY